MKDAFATPPTGMPQELFDAIKVITADGGMVAWSGAKRFNPHGAGSVCLQTSAEGLMNHAAVMISVIIRSLHMLAEQIKPGDAETRSEIWKRVLESAEAIVRACRDGDIDNVAYAQRSSVKETLMNHAQRYTAAAHAMQSGVAMMMQKGDTSTEPKHLRVGVNSAMSDISSLARLLIAKGVITEQEYFAAIADGMEREKAEYEARVQQAYGNPGIKLA